MECSMNIETTAIQDKFAVNPTPAEDARLIQNAYEAIACVGKLRKLAVALAAELTNMGLLPTPDMSPHRTN